MGWKIGNERETPLKNSRIGQTLDGKMQSLVAELVLPRGADTAGDAGCAGRASEVQHQVTAGRGTGHASSLLCAAMVHFTLWTLSHLYTVRLYNVQAHSQENQWPRHLENQLWQQVSHEKQATTADVKLLITRPETELCCQHGGGGYLFPLAHTPSSHFCRGWWGRQEERGRGIGRSVLLSITWFLDLLHVSFDSHSSFYCFF